MPDFKEFDDNYIIPYKSKKKKPRKQKSDHKHIYDVPVIVKNYYNHGNNWLYMHANKCTCCDELSYERKSWFNFDKHFKTDEEVLKEYPNILIIEKDL